MWLNKFAHGGVSGMPLGQVQPILWVIIIVEIVIFVWIIARLKEKER